MGGILDDGRVLGSAGTRRAIRAGAHRTVAHTPGQSGRVERARAAPDLGELCARSETGSASRSGAALARRLASLCPGVCAVDGVLSSLDTKVERVARARGTTTATMRRPAPDKFAPLAVLALLLASAGVAARAEVA